MRTRFDKFKKPQPFRDKRGFIVMPGILSQGGGIAFETWAEDGAAGNDWTSFTPDGTGGFTATSDGASVAIMPTDVSALDGDTVQFDFTIDTLSAGSVEFSIDESGVTADSDVDNGVVQRVTGGERSGAQAIFTTTGVKVVVIRTKKTSGANSLRPKFKYNEAGGNIVISGFTALAGQTADYWTGAIFAPENGFYPEWGCSVVRDDYAFQPIDTSAKVVRGVGKVDPFGAFDFTTGGLNLQTVDDVLYDANNGLDTADYTSQNTSLEIVTFGGYDDVIKVTVTSTSAGVYIGKGFSTRSQQGTRFAVWMPSSNTYTDGILVTDNGGSTLETFNPLPAYDEWVQIGVRHNNDSGIRINMTDNTDTGAGGNDWAGEVLYVRQLKVIELSNAGASGTGVDLSLGDTVPDYSIAMWVSPDESGTAEEIAANGNPGVGGVSEIRWYFFRNTSNELVAGIRTNVATRTVPTSTSGSFVGGSYYHLYMSVKDGEYMRFYVNGTYIGEVSLVGETQYQPANETFQLAKLCFGTNKLNGQIDQVLVYDYAGGQLDAEYLYNGGAGVATADIQATENPDPLTEEYVAAVSSVGGTVSASTQTALATFEAAIKPIRSKIHHLWMPCCDDDTNDGERIALIFDKGNQTLGEISTFQNNYTYTLTGGISNGGGQNIFDTGVVPSTDLTAEDISIGAMILTPPTDNYSFVCGCQNTVSATSGCIQLASGTTNTYAYGLGDNYTYNSPGSRSTRTGMMIVTNTTAGASPSRWLDDGTQISSADHTSITLPTVSVGYNGGRWSGGTSKNTAIIGGCFIAKALTQYQAQILSDAWNAFNTAIGRS